MASKKPVSLNHAKLYQACNLRQFEFKTTADLEPLDQPLGQDRALEAIEFGVDIEQQGFNLFVVGDTGPRQTRACAADTIASCAGLGPSIRLVLRE